MSRTPGKACLVVSSTKSIPKRRNINIPDFKILLDNTVKSNRSKLEPLEMRQGK